MVTIKTVMTKSTMTIKVNGVLISSISSTSVKMVVTESPADFSQNKEVVAYV